MSARLVLLLGILSSAVTTAQAATYTVVASRDNFIIQSLPSEVHGTEIDLDLLSGSTNGSQRRVLIGFTMPTIPSNEQITSATLQLYVSRADSITAGVHRVTDTWTEANATWTSTAADFAATATATFTPSTLSTTVSVNITSLAQGWRDGTFANNGLMIIPQTANTDVKFRSRTATTTSQRPQLVITTARIVPALTVVKSSSLVSDPLNGSTNPKAIPGAVVNYTVTVTNTNAGTADSGTTIVTEAVPATMRLYVGDVGGAGSGPVAFTNGATSSGLSYTYTSLASTTDSVAFSNNGGSTYAYTPVPDASDYDGNVTHVRVTPTGTFNGAASGNNPSFQLQMRMDVR